MKDKLQNHVVSLELAKKLKENGFPQTTLCHWVEIYNKGKMQVFFDDHWDTISGEWGDGSTIADHVNYAAPLATEIGELLPFNNTLPFWQFIEPSLAIPRGDTEANARARVWLHLNNHQNKNLL